MAEYIDARYESALERQTEFKSTRQRQSEARERRGMPPLLKTSSQLVEIVERNEQQANWGFVLFRLDYSDDELWDKFQEGFTKLIDKSIEEDEEGSTGIGRIEQGLMMKIVVDQQMKDARMEDVPGYVAFFLHHSIEGWDRRC